MKEMTRMESGIQQPKKKEICDEAKIVSPFVLLIKCFLGYDHPRATAPRSKQTEQQQPAQKRLNKHHSMAQSWHQQVTQLQG
jgi:hypothetical protein